MDSYVSYVEDHKEGAGITPGGYLDVLSEFEISGWLCGAAFNKRQETIKVVFDGRDSHLISSNSIWQDVLTAEKPPGNVGFHLEIPRLYRDGKPHSVAFFRSGGEPLTLENVQTNVKSYLFEFKAARPEASLPAKPASKKVVILDAIEETGLRGWAYDEAALYAPTTLVIYIDGMRAGEILCGDAREDVRGAGHPSSRVGFAWQIPDMFYDNQTHIIEFRGLADETIFLVGSDQYPGNLPSFKFSPVKFFGQVDGLRDGAIRGWAIMSDRHSGKKTGGLQILVTLQNQPVAQLTAGQFRADVAEAFDTTPNCGFAFVPPQNLVTGKTVEFRFKIIPRSIELDNSPYTVTFPTLDAYRKVQELTVAADRLFTQLWDLRAQIRGLLPAEPYSLANYDRWARLYHDHIAATPAPALPPKHLASPPLVSIVCPCYRPRLRDFTAAVESIIAQTYMNWELIIVDDGSGSAELAACIQAFAGRDSRIRPVFNPANGGISAATNTGLALATGQFVAFFDHDDLLVSRAIEYMVEAALRTGAKILYCDEDKIDDDGLYSDVNLKPDWNYRLILAQNYICHLLFIERKHLKKAGWLRPECDGAQDHDLILRLSEITPPLAIHHVPEILYHWRKTQSSTAASGKAKTYTVAAGIKAVSDHLAKKDLQAEIISPRGITVYDIIWSLPREPKVTIIIPYREYVDVTRECLSALRSVTEYENYEILLVDNWSTSDEALEFSEMQAIISATRVIRIEEPFNYARINNLAVAACDSEFLLFMNNDVVVRDPSWLTQMMGEALADPTVGIVGNKLLYPNRLVQHGGIILGVGGIADHAHRGLAEDDPGYMARAISAQELSAVTAACLLCRRDAFESVGGFDEADLRVAYNDVDLCLKIGKAGYRIIWTPNAVAEHRESLSRGNDFKPEHQARFFHENMVMETRWGAALKHDPHYGAYFSRQSGIFSDLKDPGS
jgi:GT2 family glycosyltransferase